MNPGSATGAMGTGWWGKETDAEGKEMEGQEEPVPSFVLMDVQGEVLVLYVYMLREGEAGGVSVEKVSYRRGGGDGG